MDPPAWEDSENEELKKLYDDVMNCAIITKAEACLMQCFCSRDDLETLRDKVRSEVLALRADGGTEKGLHDLVQGRLKLALAMKPAPA